MNPTPVMGPLSPPFPTLTADPQPSPAALETGALEMRGLKRRPCAALGAPFSPLCQLLSVLPPQSGDLVPLAYRELMLSPSSPISLPPRRSVASEAALSRVCANATAPG